MSSSALAAGLRHLRGKLAEQQHHDDSDEQLLQAFLSRRDDGAFAVLARRHGPMVLNVCRRVLGHEQDAEDAFQATFLVLAQNAASIHNKTALANFLHGTAYRTAMKAKQAAARRRKHEGQAPPRPPVDPAEDLSWREVRALLDEEANRLPEIYRSVFILCILENLSRAEAGQRLGLKERTVLSRLAEARKRLSQRLARRGVELTAVLAATAVMSPPASALPMNLMAGTLKTVLAIASGQELASVVSASVAEMVRSATAAVIGGKSKIALVLLLSLATSGSLVGWYGRASGPLAATTEPPAAKVEEKPSAAPSKRETAKTMEMQGRVLGPEGKPVSGAKLFAMHMPAPGSFDSVVRPKHVGTTDAAGHFRITIPRAEPDSPICLVAHTAGFGMDWVDLSENKRTDEVTLRLPKDVPIAGRIVNTEGRPIAGVSVSVAEIYDPTIEKLDDYLKGGTSNFWDKLNSRTPKQLHLPLDGILGKTATDKDGRFHIRGTGGERIVLVTLSGGGVARSLLRVITRPEFDAKPHNTEVRRYYTGREPVWLEIARNEFLYPPALEFVAQAGNTIEGVVKDVDSGKPIPGCRIRNTLWIVFPDNADLDIVSGDRGEYRLEGLSKHDTVVVIPPKDSRYLKRRVEVAYTARQPKIQRDIELAKGALVTGRVVDKQTGKGVRGHIRFEPLAGNKFYGSKPGTEHRGYDGGETDKEGRFRRLAIPGKSLVLFRQDNHHMEKLNGQDLCVYRGAVPDPDHKEIFQPGPIIGDQARWHVRRADGGIEEIPGSDNAVKVVDVKGNGETRVELFVDRGMTARIAVQDADGKPLAGVWAGGLTDYSPYIYKLSEATATAYALTPDKPRKMVFLHAEKKLGGTAIVRGDEKGPIIVKLSPLGQVSGRLLGADGKPLEGVEVTLGAETRSGSELDRVVTPRGKPARTGKDGRFRIEGVVPGLKFTLFLQAKAPIFGGVASLAMQQIQVKPNEKLDVGDLSNLKPWRP